MDDNATPLAEGFAPPARADWLALVDKTMKGGSLERLAARTADGLAIGPLYTAEDAPAVLADALRPRRGAERPWDIRTVVDHPDPAMANAQLLEDLEGGAASILLRLDPSGEGGVAVSGAEDLARTLAGMELELAAIALDGPGLGAGGPGAEGPGAEGLGAEGLGAATADWLAQAAKASPRARLAFHLDPLGEFAATGAAPRPVDALICEAAAAGARHAQTYPGASLFLASGRAAHEAGGTQAQELGFMAAAALAYAKALVSAGQPMAEAWPRIVLGLAADGEYFATIAKLRAARAIWARLIGACGVDAPAVIEARSSRRMLSRLDPWVNLLRLTAAGFGAAAGGADAVVLAPFTEPLGRPTAFARRQARNAQLVAMEEARIGQAADPAGGAWYVESLTDQLARAGWRAFQAIEAQGGLLAALQSGFLAREIGRASAARASSVASRERGLIGVSVFPNLAEAGVEVDAVDPAPFARPAPAHRAAGPAAACPPLRPRRDAEPFERLRAQAQAMTPRPKAYLATLGEPADSAARVGFARSLLAAAGIAAETGPARDYAPDIAPSVVLCGSDALYAEQGEDAARRLRDQGARRLHLAGRPGRHEAGLRAAGVDGFVFTGCDALAFLAHVLKPLESG